MGASGQGFAKGHPLHGTAPDITFTPRYIYINTIVSQLHNMTYRTVRLEEDVADMLTELKYDYRERSISAALRHMFHELGIEPFDEEEYEDE